ncbi:MAG: SDR family oxidoreductase [Rhodobacteraceae bacterium]|nr:SDR family oxidoreductase [Paracoccaceae bacterium]
MFSLTGRRALVTGASQGLGFAMARALAEAGAEVVLNGRDGAALNRAVSALRAAGLAATACAFDVADADARAAALSDALSAALSDGGDIDILINNVGQRHRGPVAAITPEDFAALLDVDLTAPYALARALAPAMAGRGWGRIINLCSIAGPRSRAGDAAYTAAKGGLAALTRALAMEFGPRGVLVNGIAPGYFATETNAAMVDDPAVQRFVETRIPLRRWGRPEEIGGAAVFLASDAASYVNGHVLTVDAGLSVSF